MFTLLNSKNNIKYEILYSQNYNIELFSHLRKKHFVQDFILSIFLELEILQHSYYKNKSLSLCKSVFKTPLKKTKAKLIVRTKPFLLTISM